MSSAAQRPKSPGIVFSTVLVGLVVILGSVALTARTPPPPSISEFAPQAVTQITEAPDSQSGTFGGGAEGSAGGQQEAFGAAPTKETIDVARVRRCVGDPPRQIEDPQSPPCVAYWTGDNGGATTRGVTPNEIRVVVYNGDPDNGAKVNGLLQNFFNSRFEFYGRRLRLMPPAGGGSNCAQWRAAAQANLTQRSPFAVIGSSNGSALGCFTYETARLKMIHINRGGIDTTDLQREFRPYLWRYFHQHDQVMEDWGAWACAQLVGREAAYAPEPRYKLSKRKFGLILQRENTPFAVNWENLERQLNACGATLLVRDIMLSGTGDDAGLTDFTAKTTSAVLEMKVNDVTTVFCKCPVFTAEMVSSSATAQSYYPEWVLSDIMSLNLAVKVFWPNPEQRVGLMGLTSVPANMPYNSFPLNWALSEMESGYRIQRSTALYQNLEVYWTLLLLASGIQMAGPNLTPETFERALHRTKFPNPPNPYAQGRVGFEGGSYVMIQDELAMWWGEHAPSPLSDEGAGAWCYAHDAKRFRNSQWPRQADMFRLPCHSWPPGSA